MKNRGVMGFTNVLKNTSASFSIVEQTVSMVTSAGVIPLCVVAKLIASSRNNGSVQAGHIHWSTLIHVWKKESTLILLICYWLPYAGVLMAQCNSVLDHAFVLKRDILQVLPSARSLNVLILQFFASNYWCTWFFFGDNVYQLWVTQFPLPFTQYH